MAAITIPEREPWVVARWAFVQLLDRAALELVDAPASRQRLEAAKALDGINLGRVPVEERGRLVSALVSAAGTLAHEFEARAQDDLDKSFIDALRHLECELRPTP